MNNYTLNLKISGITCDACVRLIKMKLEESIQIATINIDKNSGLTEIISDKNLQLIDIQKALLNTHHQVTPVK